MAPTIKLRPLLGRERVPFRVEGSRDPTYGGPSLSKKPEMEQAARQLRAYRRLMYLFVGGLGVIAAFSLSQLVVGRQTVLAVVEQVDAPRSCRSDSHVLFGRKARDGVPRSTMTYCGVIVTDHGGVRLPESNRFSFGSGSREALHDRLREGCTFEVGVSGWGFRLEPGGLPWSANNKILRSVRPIGTCVE